MESDPDYYQLSSNERFVRAGCEVLFAIARASIAVERTLPAAPETEKIAEFGRILDDPTALRGVVGDPPRAAASEDGGTAAGADGSAHGERRRPSLEGMPQANTVRPRTWKEALEDCKYDEAARIARADLVLASATTIASLDALLEAGTTERANPDGSLLAVALLETSRDVLAELVPLFDAVRAFQISRAAIQGKSSAASGPTLPSAETVGAELELEARQHGDLAPLAKKYMRMLLSTVVSAREQMDRLQAELSSARTGGDLQRLAAITTLLERDLPEHFEKIARAQLFLVGLLYWRNAR